MKIQIKIFSIPIKNGKVAATEKTMNIINEFLSNKNLKYISHTTNVIRKAFAGYGNQSKIELMSHSGRKSLAFRRRL